MAELSNDIGYVLYSALGSFYIPSCIMVFVYIRIYYAAKARARRGIRKPPRRPPPDDKCTSFTTTPASPAGTAFAGAGGSGGGGASPQRGLVVQGGVTLEQGGGGGIATIAQPASAPVAIPIVTCDLASDLSISDNAPDNGDSAADGGQASATCYLQAPAKDTLRLADTGTSCGRQVSRLSACRLSGSTLSVNGDVVARCRAPSVGIDTDLVSEFDPSSSDSGVISRCAVVKPLKLRLCEPIFGGRKSKAAGKRPGVETATMAKEYLVNVVAPQKPRDPEREKRRLARKKEKRATLILGLIMGSFIACWLPFFFLYILLPLCPGCDIPDSAFATAFWLGYTNSALNPVIYTIFNKDFRRAFRRILFK
ncbi:alpha-2B adrenergic receptor-like [Schistocerca piceifrons]|uniref:alpha-2B adrenergic receptor-like n=1 Tax=Schistocerca piceifrons TaxID=274613 RepID=UPI001F5F7C7B|nr:alpha-2B adrenergic receptor-like [Schistocerca piceifrons]